MHVRQGESNMDVLKETISHGEKIKYPGVYFMHNQFYAYACNYGRVVVNPGAIFTYTANGDIWFLRTKNYLPKILVNSFLEDAKCHKIR